MAWGATFDPELIAEMSAAIGRDMRAVGIHHGLSPVLDVTRDYRWGRTEETISEDPYLVGVLGTAYVKGLQSAGIIATLKHFVGYSASRAARNHAPVSVGPRELADVLLPPFEMAVREGRVKSVMASYADIDGMPPSASRELLTTILRDRWCFTGTVVADYWAVAFLEIMHRVADSPAEAARLAITAGLDIELPETGPFGKLPDLVRSGSLERGRPGYGGSPGADAEGGTRPAGPGLAAAGAGHGRRSRLVRAIEPWPGRLAEKSVVLLANDGVLPLAAGTRIALIGPSARQRAHVPGLLLLPQSCAVPARGYQHGGRRPDAATGAVRRRR